MGVQVGCKSASRSVGLAKVAPRGSGRGVFVSRVIEGGKDDDLCDVDGREWS